MPRRAAASAAVLLLLAAVPLTLEAGDVCDKRTMSSSDTVTFTAAGTASFRMTMSTGYGVAVYTTENTCDYTVQVKEDPSTCWRHSDCQYNGCDDVPSDDASYTHVARCAFDGSGPGFCRYAQPPAVRAAQGHFSGYGELCPAPPAGWERIAEGTIVAVTTRCTTRNDCHYPGCNDIWDASTSSARPAECNANGHSCTHGVLYGDDLALCDAPPAGWTPRTDFVCSQDSQCNYDGCGPSGASGRNSYCRYVALDPTFDCWNSEGWGWDGVGDTGCGKAADCQYPGCNDLAPWPGAKP
ncbi:hypothetical protein T484DRAFT_1768432 [Baffinella frigidus]|nr:hypothetical protein T484DRAFT_1768432 [Cryptophyta sp. CCMP2293]